MVISYRLFTASVHSFVITHLNEALFDPCSRRSEKRLSALRTGTGKRRPGRDTAPLNRGSGWAGQGAE